MAETKCHNLYAAKAIQNLGINGYLYANVLITLFDRSSTDALIDLHQAQLMNHFHVQTY